MAVYALNPAKFKEQYLAIETEAKANPAPHEPTLLFSFLFNAVDVNARSKEDLGEGYLSPSELEATLKKLIASQVLVNLEDKTGQQTFGEEDARTGAAIGIAANTMRTLYAMLNDIAALGADESLSQEVKSLNDKASELMSKLESRRKAHLEKQMEQNGLSKESRALKLHFGVPGLRKLDGWVNIEGVANAQFACSMNWELPFADGSVDFVYSAHTIEHLFYKSEALTFLKGIHRTLKKGGAIRIVTPDVKLLADSYVNKNEKLLTYRQNLKHYSFTSMYRSGLEHMMRYSGAGVRPWEPFTHKYSYDFETLKVLLQDAGFKDIRHCEFNDSKFPELKMDEQCSGAQQRYQEKYFSLFVEAVKS